MMPERNGGLNTMAAKKPAPKKVVPLEQYSKAELIALVKKLQKQVAKLDKHINDIAVGEVDPYDAVAETRAIVDAAANEPAPHGDFRNSRFGAAEGKQVKGDRYTEARHRARATDVPKFPWEKK
jgi:hypothetical protein